MDLGELLRMLADIVRSVHGGLEAISWAMNAVLDLFLHFVWSSCAAVLAFYLTYLTTHGLYFVSASLLHSPTSPPTQVARGMVGLSWSAALFASFAAHMWWDRLLVL